ncbi:MAG: DNA repair protein RecO [Methylobacillus sp.]|jgi:DNA repair protein RecO (recombination protein O)|nr:DNA repair protein RecO [Methylobacillus sp.]
MAAGGIARQDQQPVFVLHTYPFRETSLVVELFSRQFGRMGAIAKGARRPRSALRGMLQTFQPLLATWSGKSELRNLHALDWGEGLLLLNGDALMCGFYLNELLLRLLPREDAHEALYDHYAQTLRALASDAPHAPTLRRMELKMLQELGYAVPLTHQLDNTPILAESEYLYQPEHGALPPDARKSGVQLLGKTLLDMARDDYSDPATLLQSKQLMRMLLTHHLGDQPLHTRQLLIDLQEL